MSLGVEEVEEVGEDLNGELILAQSGQGLPGEVSSMRGLSLGHVFSGDAASRVLVSVHERHEPNEDGLDRPEGVPELRMEVAHGHADLAIGLKPTAGSAHNDRRWLHGVLLGELQNSVVHSPLEGRVVEDLSEEEEVAVQKIRFEGPRKHTFREVCLPESNIFFLDASDGDGHGGAREK